MSIKIFQHQMPVTLLQVAIKPCAEALLRSITLQYGSVVGPVLIDEFDRALKSTDTARRDTGV